MKCDRCKTTTTVNALDPWNKEIFPDAIYCKNCYREVSGD